MPPSLHAAVPIFFLYGEPRKQVGPRFLHLEALADRTVPSHWNIRPHSHAELNHVFFVTAGSGQLSADGQEMTFAAPCMLVVPAGVVHGIIYQPGAVGHVLTIADGYLRDLISREPGFAAIFASPVCLPNGDATDVQVRLRCLGQELIWNAPGNAAAIEGYLLNILVDLLRLSQHAEQNTRLTLGRAADLVAHFRMDIEIHYRSNASLADYAARLRVTAAQLRRACLQVTAQPPTILIHDRMFLEAQRVLLYTNMTVVEAAQYLGFADPAYFSRFFTKRAGQSPRAFRQLGA
jgi:AraC family transcriptional activator of pobA